VGVDVQDSAVFPTDDDAARLFVEDAAEHVERIAGAWRKRQRW
jgi:hypothetical protein